jgi:ABC-type Na+ transport system ATPase subunit NatA
MPESPGRYLRLTVTENLEYFARLYGLPARAARIKAALAAVGLTDWAYVAAGSLSKGLRQRVSLVRSLLNDPAVMFLDERHGQLLLPRRDALAPLCGIVPGAQPRNRAHPRARKLSMIARWNQFVNLTSC